MNPRLKRFGERALLGSGLESLARRAKTTKTIVLAYHNIVPDGKVVRGEASLHLEQRQFRQQLDLLTRTHDVIPLGALGRSTPSPDRPRVVITFDDAYAGSLTIGVAELVRRGIPATIFVAPGLLGSVCWWDVLADRHTGTLDDRTRRYALDALTGRSEQIRRWARDRKMGAIEHDDSLPHIGVERDLDRIASAPGITLGSHTWSHANLTGLSVENLESELRLPLEWLKTRFHSFIPWLAYPYGLSDARTEAAAARAGYVGAFRIEGGWLRQAVSLPALGLPRFNVSPGLSLEGFALRLAGIGPGA